MALENPVAFPLLPVLPGPACACPLGAKCARIGKHPAVRWRELKAGDPVPRPEPGAGAGLKTGAAPGGSGIIVVDLDGEEAAQAWEDLGGFDGSTLEVETPRGWHLYFEHPGFDVANSVSALAKGIDIRGDGGYVVAAGSPHASGGTYELLYDVPPAPAPAWLVEWLRQQPERAKPQRYDGDVTDPVELEARRERYAEYLRTSAPLRGPENRGRGDKILFDVVQVGAYDLALPTEEVLELIAEHYDPRCSPMWGDELEERVLHKAHWAKTKSTRPRNPPLTVAERAAWGSVLGPPGTGMAGRAEKTEAEDDVLPQFRARWGGWNDRPRPPRYVVENLFLEGKVNMIFADPGSIKTWLAISVAIAIASGEPWLGERAVVGGAALYVDFEDGCHEFHRRVHMLAGGHDVPQLGYLYTPGNLNSWDDFWKPLRAAHARQPFSFLVLDTLAAGTPGVDENDRNSADAISFAGRFTEQTGVTVLFLHHANKQGEIRGTSAFKANVDALFKLETLKDDGGIHRARLSCKKSGQRKVPAISLELTDEGLKRYEEPKAPEAPEEKKDRRTLNELRAEILLLIETQGPFASQEAIRHVIRARAQSVSAAMAELAAAGDIRKTEAGWIRDTEEARRARLKATLAEHPDWGRGRVLAHAGVTAEQFERFKALGVIVARSSDKEVPGYLWVDS